MLDDAVKMYGDDFGGFQVGRLPWEQVKARFCCARFCHSTGMTQVPFSGGYRVVCGRHAVVILMMTLGVLGDPSPVPEVREYARKLGVDWDRLMETEPRHPVLPEHFVCGRCGGGYLMETQGMFTGKRYVHTCGD